MQGLRHGPATYFHPNGNKEEATYVEGYEEVISRLWWLSCWWRCCCCYFHPNGGYEEVISRLCWLCCCWRWWWWRGEVILAWNPAGKRSLQPSAYFDLAVKYFGCLWRKEVFVELNYLVNKTAYEKRVAIFCYLKFKLKRQFQGESTVYYASGKVK